MTPYDYAMPFTLSNINEDLRTSGLNDGAPDRSSARRQGARAREIRPELTASRPAIGFRTATRTRSKEVYVVLRGSGRMKIDDEIVELKQWDAVRVPPGTWRGYEAGPEGLDILVIGAPNLGEDPREDVDGQRDWWAD